MMGDEMAIRSGGMYGNPESSYTKAMPSSSWSGGGSISPVGRIAKSMVNTGLKADALMTQHVYEYNQGLLNLEALRKERDYNVENFQQNMADTLASNKMSFYASGLDLSGTAMDVTMANQAALQKDLSMMNYNYNIREKNIKNKLKASKENYKAGQRQLVADFVTSLF